MPGSTFKYGSNFLTLTLKHLNCNKAASEAEERPFPSYETTPPVTNTYRAMEGQYSKFLIKNKDNYNSDFGI